MQGSRALNGAMREFDPRCVPQPRSEVLFPDVAGPIDLEIGCGAGYHPILYAKREPERTLVAIERTQTRFARFEGRLVGHPELTNIVPVNADAVRWVTHRVPEQAVERIFLLYPNPYPKKGQANKRWHFMPFMGRLLGALASGGSLALSTNMEFYAEEAEHLSLIHI